MEHFTLAIILVSTLFGAVYEPAGIHDEHDVPVLTSPRPVDRPQPLTPRAVVGVPAHSRQSAPYTRALDESATLVDPLRDAISYLFPGRAFGLGGGEGISLVAADLNDDGLLDLAVAHSRANLGPELHAITIHYGRANGTFGTIEEAELYPAGNDFHNGPVSIAAGHFDLDGRLDLVVLNYESGGLQLLLSQPGGGFAYGESFAASGWFIATGDFDGNGCADVVTDRGNLRYGQCDGTLGSPSGTTCGQVFGPQPVVADLNRDGIDDLVQGFRSDYPSTQMYFCVQYGEQGVGLGESQRYNVNRAPIGLAVGDFDGDGLKDIAGVGGEYGYYCPSNVDCEWLHIFYGTPDGAFGRRRYLGGWAEFAPGTFHPSQGGKIVPKFLSAADLDGNGRDDLAIDFTWSQWYIVNQSALTALYGPGDDGDWSFRQTTFRAGGSGWLGQHTTADVDRDGRPELLSMGGGVVDYDRMQGKLATRIDDIELGVDLRAIATGDIDGDGFSDLAMADREAMRAYVLWGNGTGKFQQDPTMFQTDSAAFNIALADVNGNGLLDLIVSTSADVLRVFHQTGSRVFAEPVDYSFTGDGRSLAIGYFDEHELDGVRLVDVAVGDTVLFGQADGTLANPVEFGVSGDIMAVDFDRDGWMDLAGRFGEDSRSLGVAFNDGGTGFADPQGLQLSAIPRACAVGDFNGDGYWDLASDTGTIEVVWGDVGGSFAGTDQCAEVPTGTGVGLTAADFNRDGIDDLCLGTYFAILLGQEEGCFAEPRYYLSTANAFDLATGDFNRDGRLDIAGVNGTVGYSVLLNQDKHKAAGDLEAVSITAPAMGVTGETVDVAWVVGNKRSRALTAKWTDALYLSTDATWDIWDRHLGVLEYVGTLEALADYERSGIAVQIPAVQVGDYYLLARTDVYNDIQEDEGEGDNVAVTPIHVDVPALNVCPAGSTPAECPGLDDEFPSIPGMRQYKVDAVEGEDLLVTLDATAEMGIVELYIRYDYPATRSTFDAKYDVVSNPDQTVRVPGTQAGWYYILAYGDMLVGNSAAFNIRVEYLPFELNGIGVSSGGNAGNVTLELTGSRFRPDTLAYLVDSDEVMLQGDPIYLENTGSLWPTFDLRDLEPGTYDVRLDDAGAIRTLFSAFTVVPGGAPAFDAHFAMPGPVRVHTIGGTAEVGFSLEYTNHGNVDMIAPLLIVESNKYSMWLPHDIHHKFTTEQFIAVSSSGPAGILGPGATNRIEFRGIGPTRIALRRMMATSTIPIDWESMYMDIRPGSIPEEYWEEHWREILARLGNASGDYISSLAREATRQGAPSSRGSSARSFLVRELYVSATVDQYDPADAVQYGTIFCDKFCDDGVFYCGEPTNEVKHATTYGQPLSEVLGPASSCGNDGYGHDCAHFVSACLSAGGLNISQPGCSLLENEVSNIATPEDLGNLQPGDVVFTDGHVVLYVGNGVGVEHSGNPPIQDWCQTLVNGGRGYHFADFEGNDDDDDTNPPDPDYGDPIDSNGDGRWGWDTDGDGVEDAYDTDGDGRPDDFDGDGLPDDEPIIVIAPRDPNDKLSPYGYGEVGFVAEDYAIPYTIRFENLAAATAAALKIEVTDQLHENLAWETLTLDEIGFAGTVIDVPDGLDHYEGRVELDGWTWDEEEERWRQYDDTETPLVPLVVDVEAGIDLDTGVVNWSIVCADVNTGYFPEDPFAGFLPPNQESIFYPDPDDPNDPPRLIHPGEGYLTYSVAPVADLPTGTEITNEASIVFDWNEAIKTPEVLNTIDAVAPTSTVDALPVEIPYAHFDVCWSGEDDAGGSGVEGYTVYVSDNGESYSTWLTTEDECAWFTGARVGHTYDFYSVARDHVGHVEAPPTDPGDGSVIPDTTTTIVGLLADFDGDNDVDLDDYFFVEICLSVSGPGVAPAFQECEDLFDLDDIPDGDVDLRDLAVFQRLFTGEY